MKKIKLLKGKYYSIYVTGGSHPALVFKKNKRRNKYYVVVFDSSKGRHRTKLKHPTSKNIKESFVQNRPYLGVKKDFGNHELLGINVNKEDKPTIEIVKRRKPKETKRYKQKNRCAF